MRTFLVAALALATTSLARAADFPRRELLHGA